jgi:hypothetical protein
MLRSYALCLTLLASAACSNQAPDAAPAAAVPAQLEPVPAGHPPIVAPPDPELAGGHVGRAPRRLTTAQLKASIRVTTGRDWSQIDNLAASLGRADYALVNAEATETNLVFAKFLDDGAREVCLAAADADLKQTDVTQGAGLPVRPAQRGRRAQQTHGGSRGRQQERHAGGLCVGLPGKP